MVRIFPLVVLVGLAAAGCHTGRAETPIAMLGERRPTATAPSPKVPTAPATKPAPAALATWRAEYYEIGPG